MSFIYGQADTADLPGVTATLRQWPSLGGLTVDNTPIPGGNGRFHAGSNRERTALVFDVIIAGGTPDEVHRRRDDFISLIDPSRGARPLQAEGDTEWRWPDVLVTQEIAWDRMTWDKGLGYRLRADVEFETQRGAGAVEVNPRSHAGDGEVTFTADRGNTASFPTVTFPSGGDLRVQVNDFELDLTGTPEGLTVSLDWTRFRFDLLTAAGDRAGSLVPYMSHYERPSITPGQQVTAQVGRLGEVTYEWEDAPHESHGIKLLNGVEVGRNYVINGDFENGMYGWESASSSPSSTTVYNDRMWGGLGGHLAYVEVDTDTRYADIHQHIDGPFQPGQWVAVSGYVANDSDMRTRIQITWYRDNGGSDWSTTDWSTTRFYSGRWLYEAFEVPFNATHIRYQVQTDKTDGDSGKRFWVDRHIFVYGASEQSVLEQVQTYFDGDTAGSSVIMPEPMVLYPNYRRI